MEKNKKGFTLIELLVVIAVLAGFMALLLPNYMQVRMKSRDVRRKGDLVSIQKAIELYKLGQATPFYPPALVAGNQLIDANSTVYMQKVPQDPLAGAVSIPYYYARNGVDFSKYILCACLENPNDPEKSPCAGAPACASGQFYKLIEP